MRNLFIVLAKVVGLLQIPGIIRYVERLIRTFLYLQQSGGFPRSAHELYSEMMIFCLVIALYFGIIYVLLWQTTWIADRLRLPSGEVILPETKILFRICIQLLGLYIIVESIPEFYRLMDIPSGIYDDPETSRFWAQAVPSLLKFAFGLLLVLKTTKIIELISRDAKPKEPLSA